MQKDLTRLLTSPQTALALQYAGISAPSVFIYRQDDDGHYYPEVNDDMQAGLPAYTSGELGELLPGALEVNRHTWKASPRGWKKLTAKDVHYPFAHLQTTKTLETYVAGYFHHNQQIAFSISGEGKHNNLLIAEETEQEALAILLLTLMHEGKYER